MEDQRETLRRRARDGKADRGTGKTWQICVCVSALPSWATVPICRMNLLSLYQHTIEVLHHKRAHWELLE